MNHDKLKVIIKNLEILLEQLKSEVYSNTEAYRSNPSMFGFICEDDDGYTD
jgi:hypothetical protein